MNLERVIDILQHETIRRFPSLVPIDDFNEAIQIAIKCVQEIIYQEEHQNSIGQMEE